jgi:L-methionine (R)-S-oxide reductase
MAETIKINRGSKGDKYNSLVPQVRALVEGEKDQVANMANICAALKIAMGFFWVGFYIVRENELVLGPFQGPVACTRIARGKGVCGTAWQRGETIIVPDVDRFPGHIACSSESKSEIVIPLKRADGKVWGVLDVDSNKLDDFDEIDSKFLCEVAKLIS